MKNITEIFMRHAVRFFDAYSYNLIEGENERLRRLAFVIDRRNRIWAQKIPIKDEQDFEMTCYHEAGHALVQNKLFPDYATIKVCVIESPDHRAYSYDDTHTISSRTRKQMICQIASLFGGYCAEKLVFGDTTEGCEDDINDIKDIIRDMIQKHKMAPELISPIECRSRRTCSILGINVFSISHRRDMKLTEPERKKYKKFLKEIMDEAEAMATSILENNREQLDALAKELMSQRVLLQPEIADILAF